MSNNTYKTIWNPILNALPQNQRGAYKCANIAQVERQKVGTPSYRILNVYVGTVSPVVGHPWTTSGEINASYAFQDSLTSTIYTLTITNGALTVTQTGSSSSGLLVFSDIVTNSLYSISISGVSMVINSYVGVVSPISALILVDTVTSTKYSLYISDGIIHSMKV